MTLITLLCFAVLLSACSSSNAESKNIKDYPVGVQDGTVSAKFYDELEDFSTLNNLHQIEINEMFKDVEENSKLLYSSDFGQQLTKKLSKYNDFLIESNFVGNTDAEKELSLLLADVTEHQLTINFSLENYITSKSIFQLIPLAVKMDTMETKSEKFDKAMERYNILEEQDN